MSDAPATELIEGHRPIAAPPGVAEWDVDPYDPEILKNPEPFYRELRAKGPFVYLSRYAMLACGRYEETHEVFSDHERFVSSRGVGLQDFSLDEPWRPPSKLLEADPPAHDTVRRVIVRSMAPNVVASIRDMFKQAADGLITELVGKRSFDGVHDLARVFPTTVFPEAVGMRENDPDRLVDYGSMVFNAIGPDNEARRSAMAKGPDVVPWITAACERQHLENTGIGGIIYAAADAGEITEHEAGMLVRSLFSAGVDTTISGIASALYCLTANPEAFAELKASPNLARRCFEETLRMFAPVHSFCRTANLDTEVAGVPIEEGSKILCMLGSANLDEEYWPNATTFDINRRPVGHLAFGMGILNCPGQNVARTEAEAVLMAIAEKVDTLAFDGEPEWGVNNSVRYLKKLPLTLNQVMHT